MPFGNSERSWIDEFWSLWHCDRPVDLEDANPRDLWAYDELKEPSRIIAESHGCHFISYTIDPAQPKLDEN